MKEYTELKNQTEQGSQVATIQVEDREDEMKISSRREKNQEKEKGGADEARAEQMKERAKNFISEKLAAIMEGSLKDRASLPKEGSKKFSPFVEMMEKRG